MDEPQRAPRRGLAAVGLAVAVVAGALLGRIEDPTALETGTPAPDPGPLGEWRLLRDPPAAWSRPPRVVWTGEEALVWTTGRDGAALLLGYDPAADAWREAARPPLAARAQAVVAWTQPTGAAPELVVWGGVGRDQRTVLADGAAYDPAADRWRVLPEAPLTPRAAAAHAWTGSELIVAGGVGEQVRRHDGAAYDPVADRWQPIAGLPPAGRLLGYTAFGPSRRLTVVAAGRDGVRLLRYNRAHDRWRAEVLPLSPIGHRAVVAAGGRLVVWGGRSGHGPAGLVWDGPGMVRELHALAPRGFHGAAWTGEQVIVWGGYDASGRRDDGAALDPSSGMWRPLSESPLSARTLPGVVWTGRELLVIGGTDDRGAAVGGAAWCPQPGCA